VLKIPKKSKNYSEKKKNELHLSISAKHPGIENAHKNPEKNNICFLSATILLFYTRS